MAYQRDDGGTGAGQRHDVEVVGQVELWRRGGKLARGGRKENGGGVRSASSHLAGVADVSQSGSTSFARCGVPGNNACGIREMKHHRTTAFSSETRSFFLPRDCVIEGIMN